MTAYALLALIAVCEVINALGTVRGYFSDRKYEERYENQTD
jgi:hypothetical protein